jgi:hypothetical protein
MLGLSTESVSDFSSHTDCRLGKWYYQGEGQSCYSKLSGYREMESPHKRVHERAIATLQAQVSGDYQQMAQFAGEMESASLDVLASLERITRSGEENSDLLCAQL